MPRGEKWVSRLTEGLNLPAEAIPGIPLVEIFGHSRILIEHHQGVSCYGQEQICVKVKNGQIAICGCGLELAHMSREQLVICGRIHMVQLL